MLLKKLPVFVGTEFLTDAHLAIMTSGGVSIPLEMESRCKELHPNHRVPYVLSRLAASSALSTVLGKPITFSGSRHDAEQYDANLSLSHEDFVGAAVAWRKGTSNAIGIDVVDVQQLERVVKRFPQFAARFMPRCDLSALSSVDACNIERTFRGHADQVTVTLSQHWGLRECCVKLVGVEGRTFPFECFRGPRAYFPDRFKAQVVEEGSDALRAAGLNSSLFVSTWPELLKLPSGDVKPYIVVVAACPRKSAV
ncbi:uncharacterized protein TEOVI_000564400 [Trypanosoma equiperdum]|uniref:Uncharacterized protein n=2 Tax=Trypanozoon TaxID=39700 RepID=Q382D6_TRYB2|nr:hypothetical protein, conserved [Trypanosoma brucei brucei TREU927]EAN80345.1 hypothetical protein, conserved [Trypanosoma brucei brucei TREU927]SCU64559.1 hypothetical protein, conserved [Trypanosoma equiperdum]